MDLEYLIRHETENTNVDFKAIQYEKSAHEDLLKDIISMANARSKEDRYIIVGVNLKNSGERDVVGIKKDEFIDSARYQQLVYENIEPEIQFDYFSYEIDEEIVGVFHIRDCSDKPYMMKKSYGKLQKGDSFIRRGDSQDRMIRKDYELIIEQRLNSRSFESYVSIGFDTEGAPKTIKLPVTGAIEFPSEKAEERIKEILEKKKNKKKAENELNNKNLEAFKKMGLKDIEAFNAIQSLSSSFENKLYLFGGKPYEERTIEELEEALSKIEEWYREDDLHVLFEKNSNKINLQIKNNSQSYIEDATLKMIIKKMDGVIIADKIYHKPQEKSPLKPNINPKVYLTKFYPTVNENENNYIISTHVGDVKHHIPETVFGEPLRILFSPNLKGKKIKVLVKLFGKNVRKPIEQNLQIEVIDQKEANFKH